MPTTRKTLLPVKVGPQWAFSFLAAATFGSRSLRTVFHGVQWMKDGCVKRTHSDAEGHRNVARSLKAGHSNVQNGKIMYVCEYIFICLQLLQLLVLPSLEPHKVLFLTSPPLTSHDWDDYSGWMWVAATNGELHPQMFNLQKKSNYQSIKTKFIC